MGRKLNSLVAAAAIAVAGAAYFSTKETPEKEKPVAASTDAASGDANKIPRDVLEKVKAVMAAPAPSDAGTLSETYEQHIESLITQALSGPNPEVQEALSIELENNKETAKIIARMGLPKHFQSWCFCAAEINTEFERTKSDYEKYAEKYETNESLELYRPIFANGKVLIENSKDAEETFAFKDPRFLRMIGQTRESMHALLSEAAELYGINDNIDCVLREMGIVDTDK